MFSGLSVVFVIFLFAGSLYAYNKFEQYKSVNTVGKALEEIERIGDFSKYQKEHNLKILAQNTLKTKEVPISVSSREAAIKEPSRKTETISIPFKPVISPFGMTWNDWVKYNREVDTLIHRINTTKAS